MSIGRVWEYALLGLQDALVPKPTLLFYLTSALIRKNVLKCFVMNGIIFLGSIALFERVVLPVLRMWNPFTSSHELTLTALYNVLWLGPLYCLSFVLNELWYRSIATEAFLMRHPEHVPPSLTYQTALLRVADEIYRQMILLTYILIATVFTFHPFGKLVAAMLLSWIYAYFCFEYKWIQLRWTLEMRLRWFEDRWAYFMGFGMPCAILTLMFPIFTGAGFFALIFPYFILIANDSVPRPKMHSGDGKVDQAGSEPTLPARIPVFALARAINKKVISLVFPKR